MLIDIPSNEELWAALQQSFLVGWAPVAIFIMATAGFALLYAGMVRKKNVSHTIIMINVGWTLAFLMYYVIGYPLAYYSTNPFIGLPQWLPTVPNPLPPGLESIEGVGPYFTGIGGDMAGWFKMSMFAITVIGIVPGALAERDKFWGWIIAAALISGIIYPIVEHWVWSGVGWLNNIGFIDYAGSGVVHLTGGMLALTGAKMIGPRIGKFVGKDKNPRPFFGHSIPLSTIGAWLLVFGWFGFNIGSSTAENQASITAELSWVSITTAMAMAGGLFGAAATSRGHVLTSMVGLLSGAVSICSGAAIMNPLFAFVTGLVAGVITTFAYSLLEYKLHIDDALTAFPVHGACGIWGLVATGLFGSDALGGHPSLAFSTSEWLPQIGIQVIGAVAIAVFVFGMGLLMFFILKKLNLLRVNKDEELFGLDISIHKTFAYPEEMKDEGILR
ncbi:MAG: ammonium transporter [Candidatus Lokiarchaeota archaeon]|nr:ammonium transporter [Candidatus Lokiarchaeota archaeon]